MTEHSGMGCSATSTRSAAPYDNFRFRVQWGGRCVAGFSGLRALGTSADNTDWREGHEVRAARTLAGVSKPGAIILESGITCDPEFEAWARQSCSADGDAASAKDADGIGHDLVIETYDAAGGLALTALVFRCRVSGFVALPGLDGNGSAVAIRSMRLENEGWSRDPAID
jgi:phage tail-like protein